MILKEEEQEQGKCKRQLRMSLSENWSRLSKNRRRYRRAGPGLGEVSGGGWELKE